MTELNVLKWPPSFFFISAAQQDTMIVSLCDYPVFERTELTMCIGEQLTILSEYVIWFLLIHCSPCFQTDRHSYW